MKLRNYVANLSDQDRISIIESYEEFEQNGFIGNRAVRTFARDFIESIGIEDPNIVRWMTMIALECYRHYYHNPR